MSRSKGFHFGIDEQRDGQRTVDMTSEEGLALALLEHALQGLPSGWLSATATRPTRSAASRGGGTEDGFEENVAAA